MEDLFPPFATSRNTVYVDSAGETKTAPAHATFPSSRASAPPSPPPVSAWVETFAGWDTGTQLIALYYLLWALPLSLLTTLTMWLPQIHTRDFVGSTPAKVSRTILLYLDMVTLAKATQVSKAWRQRAEDQALWEGYCRSGWPLHVRARIGNAAHSIPPADDNDNDAQAGMLSVWKNVFRQRWLVDRGWDRGLFAQSVLPDTAPRRSFAFDDVADGAVGKIVSGGFTEVYFTDLYTGERTGAIEGHHGSWVYAVEYADVFDTLVTGCWDGGVRVFELESGKLKTELFGHTGGVWAIAPTFADARLASASNDGTVRIWDMEIGVCTALLQGHAKGVYDIQALTDGGLGHGTLYMTASADSMIKLWDPRVSLSPVANYKGHSDVVSCLQVDSRTMFSGSYDGLIKGWDLSAGKSSAVADYEGALHRIKCLQFDDAKIVGGASDGTLRVWNRRDVRPSPTGSFKPMYTLYGHTSEVNACAFNDDKLVSSSRDDTLRVWRVVDDPDLVAEHNAAAASISPQAAAAIQSANPANPNPLSLHILDSPAPGARPTSRPGSARPSSARPGSARPGSAPRPSSASPRRRRRRQS